MTTRRAVRSGGQPVWRMQPASVAVEIVRLAALVLLAVLAITVVLPALLELAGASFR